MPSLLPGFLTSALSLTVTVTFTLLLSGEAHARQVGATSKTESASLIRFAFEDDLMNTTKPSVVGQTSSASSAPLFVQGLSGKAIRFHSEGAATEVQFAGTQLPFRAGQDFSVMFWVRSTASDATRMVLLAHKEIADVSLAAQKQPGWAFSMANGTWAWNLGSGGRRLRYERDNGEHMPLNDGKWHQLAMTYDHQLALVRLFYDGINAASYGVGDSRGFDFAGDRPLRLGWAGKSSTPPGTVIPAIQDGARALQDLVDAYRSFGLGELESGEFVRLIVEPQTLFKEKVRARGQEFGTEGTDYVDEMLQSDLSALESAEAALMRNPYTIHQAFTFMDAAPLLKIYEMMGGRVAIKQEAALAFSEMERLHPCDFDADELTVWNRALSANEVQQAYAVHLPLVVTEPKPKVKQLTVGVWNIFHGGKHFTADEHGWDSRVAIAQIIKDEGIDLVMMQETYSSGDFIAAELGFTYATTVDWDYLNQGANLSVLSRFPILEVKIPPNSPFMNVGVRVAISESQDLWVMSNWYGMNQFDDVYSFHEDRFSKADETPVLFGGDFNAVPHTDGGNSHASPILLDAGFTDAFRDLHPDPQQSPGLTHRNGSRIDQLYYLGSMLRNTSTRIINSWPIGFPSDHYLITADFEIR